MGISLDQIESSLHDIAIKSSGGTELAIDGSGFITANINGSVTVSATDLDIRDLTSASDSVEIKTAAGQALAIDGSGFITANINGSVTVSATDLDIRDLTHVSDSVQIGDGTDLLAINADGSLNVNTVPGGMSTWKVSAESVTTIESELVSVPLSSRLCILVQNLGTADIYVKEATGVTTANGMLIPKGSSFEACLDDGANLFAITGSGTSDVRVVEYAA